MHALAHAGLSVKEMQARHGMVGDADEIFGKAQESAPAGGTVTVTIKGDPRPMRRDLKAAQAAADSLYKPRRAHALRALLSHEHVVRHALGEMDDDA